MPRSRVPTLHAYRLSLRSDPDYYAGEHARLDCSNETRVIYSHAAAAVATPAGGAMATERQEAEGREGRSIQGCLWRPDRERERRLLPGQPTGLHCDGPSRCRCEMPRDDGRKPLQGGNVHSSLMDVLCCPHCAGPLSIATVGSAAIEVEAGHLTCGACGREYTIENGVGVMGNADDLHAAADPFADGLLTHDLLRENLASQERWATDWPVFAGWMQRVAGTEGVIVDIASGPGCSIIAALVPLLTERTHVVVSDAHVGLLRLLREVWRERPRAAPLDFLAFDACRMPFREGALAAITSTGGFQNIRQGLVNRSQPLPEAYGGAFDALRPGGHLFDWILVYAPETETAAYLDEHGWHWGIERAMKEVWRSVGFDIVSAEETHRWPMAKREGEAVPVVDGDECYMVATVLRKPKRGHARLTGHDLDPLRRSTGRYSQQTTQGLIGLICQYEAGVPLELAQEIVSRGTAAVPALCQIVADEDRWREADSAAAVHAMHLLGAIGDPAAISALLAPLFWVEGSDFITENMPGVLAQLGPTAIPLLREFVHDPEQDLLMRCVAYSGLVGMALLHPDLEVQVKTIGRQLAIRCLLQGELFPSLIGADLAEYQDPADLLLLEKVYQSGLWDDPGGWPWEDVLASFAEGRVEPQTEIVIRDPMAYFAPEEQARLRQVWDERRRR
jgi:uncharacterized protein YbaR (Trm112 family)